MDQGTLLAILGISATIIIGVWQIYLAQQQLIRDRRKKNQVQQSSTPSAASATPHPSPWLQTNHSMANIGYEPIRDRAVKTRIYDVLEKHYRAYVGRSYRVTAVDELSASLNYRVQGIGKKPILLRFHKIITSENALMTLQAIQRHVFEYGVFADSPFEDCLVPLPSTSGKTFEQVNNQLIEVYPFADNVLHYSGKSLTQVQDFARKYGLLQKSLRDLDISVNLDLLGSLHPYMSWFQGDQSFFDLICKINNRAITKPNPDRLSLLFNQYQTFLRKIWHEVKPYLAQEEDVLLKPALDNLHPHNTFFQDDKCVLIYDYDPVLKNTREIDVLAFAMHRFIREYIRSLLQRGHVGAETEISATVDTFLEYYSSAGLSVPSNLKKNLSLAIKKTNLAKLLHIMSIVYGMAEDGDRRNNDIWYTEAIKFISYLEESDHFISQKN